MNPQKKQNLVASLKAHIANDELEPKKKARVSAAARRDKFWAVDVEAVVAKDPRALRFLRPTVAKCAEVDEPDVRMVLVRIEREGEDAIYKLAKGALHPQRNVIVMSGPESKALASIKEKYGADKSEATVVMSQGDMEGCLEVAREVAAEPELPAQPASPVGSDVLTAFLAAKGIEGAEFENFAAGYQAESPEAAGEPPAGFSAAARDLYVDHFGEAAFSAAVAGAAAPPEEALLSWSSSSLSEGEMAARVAVVRGTKAAVSESADEGYRIEHRSFLVAAKLAAEVSRVDGSILGRRFALERPGASSYNKARAVYGDRSPECAFLIFESKVDRDAFCAVVPRLGLSAMRSVMQEDAVKITAEPWKKKSKAAKAYLPSPPL